jgi:hypothetical protein
VASNRPNPRVEGLFTVTAILLPQYRLRLYQVRRRTTPRSPSLPYTLLITWLPLNSRKHKVRAVLFSLVSHRPYLAITCQVQSMDGGPKRANEHMTLVVFRPGLTDYPCIASNVTEQAKLQNAIILPDCGRPLFTGVETDLSWSIPATPTCSMNLLRIVTLVILLCCGRP